VSSAPPPIDTRAPRHCIKCGREVSPDESICEVCNRAGMATPSASQYHGTMVVAIIAGVVGLAIWASLAMRGVGPYEARVIAVQPAPPGAVEVTVEVENLGTARGYGKCQLRALDAAGSVLRVQPLSAGPLEGGASGTFSGRIAGLGELPESVAVSCT
jgi:predicted nucleic acid-binding Zn ribbon protein